MYAETIVRNIASRLGVPLTDDMSLNDMEKAVAAGATELQSRLKEYRHALALCIAVMDESDGRAWTTAANVLSKHGDAFLLQQPPPLRPSHKHDGGRRIRAWSDWERVASSADQALVAKFRPSPEASWRQIDAARHKLEAAIKERN